MALRLKLLFALVFVLVLWPLLLGAPLAPPTDCSMPTPAPLAMTTIAPPTVSTTWEAPPTVTSTSEAPPTQSPAPIVEEEPCEVYDYDLLT